MSEQDGTQSSTKQRRSRKTNTTNQENGMQVPVVQRPANDDTEAWKAYWKQQGQPWRTEPEIDAERQKYLAERRSITPDIVQGIYPFKDIKLNRADVEWLLATNENGRGPVDWNDESQREREGIDVRGADLRQAKLSGLPLARMRGGLTFEEWLEVIEEQGSMTAVHMQKADLVKAQLQGADLREAQLQGADLREVQLQKANLWRAQLQKANLWRAQLQGADLVEAQLQKADLVKAQLQGADLRSTELEKAKLDETILSDDMYGSARLADVDWGNVNLAVIDWTLVKRLGDEGIARQTKKVDDYQEAVRANRQLAVMLRDQGLNEQADHFAYRAQLLQRVVVRRQRKIGRYLFSGFLDLLAGYGYRPVRSVAWYVIIIVGFALAYFAFGHIPPLEAFVFSLTSFHGRGFFPGNNISLSDPRVVVAAFEAVVGLLIEISFIATFTQRFFGK